MLKLIATDTKSSTSEKLWFNDDEHDLFVWIDKSNHPVGFQFSYRQYGKNYSEHVISWKKDTGYSHDKIDDGEHGSGDYKMTPILIPDGVFDFERVAEEFNSISTDMDKEIANFIYQKLRDYPAGS